MMKSCKNYSCLFLMIGALLFAGACGKEEKQAEPANPEATKPAEPAVKEPPKEAAKPVATPAKPVDSIKIIAAHEPKAPTDPVEIVVQKFAVKSAKFDPQNLEGGTAEIELDMTSIKSDKEKRDMHLQTPDYLDTVKFGTAIIRISDVKKDGDNSYTAQAEARAHGVTKAFPVKFTVTETTADSIRVQAEHAFDRLDFGVGQEPDGENEKVAKQVTIKMELTLKNM